MVGVRASIRLSTRLITDYGEFFQNESRRSVVAHHRNVSCTLYSVWSLLISTSGVVLSIYYPRIISFITNLEVCLMSHASTEQLLADTARKAA